MRVAFYKYHTPGISGLFARLTRLLTAGPYSHCEDIFSNGEAFSSSIQDDGARFKWITFDPARWDVLEIDVRPEKEVEAYQFCLEEKGCKYDFLGIGRFIIPWVRESKTRWFCSEICTATMQKAGVLPAEIPVYLVHPTLLYWLLIAAGARRVNV